MQEWWTYSPSDFLMYSARTYYRLVELHNARVWPAPAVTLVVGAAAVVLARRAELRAHQVAAWLLGGAWAFVAWAWFARSYATIHTFGYWFGAAFAVQAIALLWIALFRPLADAGANGAGGRRAGVAIAGAALVVQPLIALLLGRPWTQLEVFGVTPDATVTVTLGLLLAMPEARWWLWIVPVVWCAFSGMTLWTLHAGDALVGPVVAVAAVALGMAQARRPR